MAYISDNDFQQKIDEIDRQQGRSPRFPNANPAPATLTDALMNARQGKIDAGKSTGTLADMLYRRKTGLEQASQQIDDQAR